MEQHPLSTNYKQTYLPHLDHIKRHRPYKNSQSEKQNVLKDDVDNVIATLAKQPTPCQQKLQHINRKYFERKLNFRISSVASEVFTQNISPQAIKSIRLEISKYIQRLQLQQITEKNDYREFVKLSQESEDYLQFYLKHHFKKTNSNDLIHQQEKYVILSLLKNHYKCLTHNPPEIANRILLSFQINPLNDFHFVSWHQFSRFIKLATSNCTKTELKIFLADFFIPKIEKKGTKHEFWTILGATLRKLEKVISKSNVDRLIQRVQKIGAEIVPQQLNRKQLKKLITNQPLFLWQQLAKLIFFI